MKQLFLLLTCLSFLTASAQVEKSKSIEVTLLARWDKHADYHTGYGSRSYTNHTQLAGLSYGLALGYKYPLAPHLSVKAAAGYYQLHIDQVRQGTPWGITARARNFEDRLDSTARLHSTGKYHYNTLPLSVGVQAAVPLRRSASLTSGVDVLYYATFSQRYHRTYTADYKTADVRTLGWGVTAQAGWRKQWNGLYVHPQILVPVYQALNGDPVFLEAESLRIAKWFNGGGIAVSIGKYL